MEKSTTKKKMLYCKKIIYVLTAGWIAIWVYRTALTPIYPQLSSYFGGASDAQIGTISSSYFLGYVTMQIPSGILVDRIGRKKILIPGFIAFAVGALIVALSQTLPILYLGSIIAGMGCGTYYGVAYSLTAIHVPNSRKSLATAIVNSGTAVGSGLGLITSSFFVAEHGLPWQFVIYFSIILILIMIFVFRKMIRPDDPRKIAEVSVPEDEVVEEVEKQSMMKSLMRPKIISAYILYFSTCYAYYLTDTWLPNFLSTERGFEGGTIGLASSMVFFAAIPGAIFFSRIADRFAHRKITLIIILEVAAAIMLFVAVDAKSSAGLMFALIMYGFLGKLAVEPIIISWLSDHSPRVGIGTTLGVFNFFGMLSSIIAPSLTGVISDRTGSKVLAFDMAAILLVIGAGIFLVVNSRKKEK